MHETISYYLEAFWIQISRGVRNYSKSRQWLQELLRFTAGIRKSIGNFSIRNHNSMLICFSQIFSILSIISYTIPYQINKNKFRVKPRFQRFPNHIDKKSELRTLQDRYGRFKQISSIQIFHSSSNYSFSAQNFCIHCIIMSTLYTIHAIR